MQKKFSSEIKTDSNAPPGSIIISAGDLNSEESIKNWIKQSLGHEDPELKNSQIITALEGIVRDPIFIKQPEASKQVFINQINELIKKLK